MPPRSDPYAEALQFARASKFEAAAAAVDRLLARAPRNVDGLVLKASIRLALGQAADALAVSDAAIVVNAGSARAHAARADALQALQRYQEAVESYDQALAIEPRQVAAHSNRGNALAELDRLEEALVSYGRGLTMAPDTPQLHSNRARVLNDLRRFDEAVESADRALALNPHYANAWLHRGKAFYGALRFSEALESFQAAARIDPRSGDVLSNLGMGLAAVGRYDEALAALDKAVSLAPTSFDARYQRARVRLLLGDFAGGWDDYECRWKNKLFVATGSGCVTERARGRMSPAASPADFAGARVLLLAEQGVGDQIMFVSMIADVLAVAASTTLVCEARLAGLLSGSFPALNILEPAAVHTLGFDDFDRIVPIGSLGVALRRERAAFPATAYLAPRPALVERWRERLGPAHGRMRVGISWRGGTPVTGAAARSISLSQLAPLFDLEGCDIVSLQYGDAAGDIAAADLGGKIAVFPPDEIDDFEQLAALTLALDLVVTIQTALVHLCGAVGQRAVVMVPKRPEWRYMAAGASMPWYESVSIVRQGELDAWDGVIAQAVDAVAMSLRDFAAGARDRS